jgi:hypothetical protein
VVKEPRSSSLSPTDGERDGISQGSDESEPATVDAVPGAPPDELLSETGGATKTHSVPAAASAASSRGPRSIPSVPRIGIPRALRGWERYEVQSVLGAGGMGAVYKARDPRLNRFIALKIVHPRLGHSTTGSAGQSYVRRFEREARLQASLDHPHICKVYEIGELPSSGDDEEAGYPYIAMQLISGKPLQRIHGEMSLFEKVRVIQQVAEALHAAHRQGLVHRDIKPSAVAGPLVRR